MKTLPCWVGALLGGMLSITWCAGASGNLSSAGQQSPPETMTRIVVRLTGPGIKAGSFAALPKTIYRAGERYARIEDPPDARQKIQKLTVVDGPDAYSANLIDKKGTHAVVDGVASNTLRLPIVLPLDPQHRLGKLDSIEFGAEYDFFKAARAVKQAGPPINAKPTDSYLLRTPEGPASLIVRGGSDVPVFLSWQSSGGTYKYEFITYEDVPFQRNLFAKPAGIVWRQIPPDPNAATGDH